MKIHHHKTGWFILIALFFASCSASDFTPTHIAKIELSPDGKRVAASGHSVDLSFWSFPEGKEEKSYPDHDHYNPAFIGGENNFIICKSNRYGTPLKWVGKVTSINASDKKEIAEISWESSCWESVVSAKNKFMAGSNPENVLLLKTDAKGALRKKELKVSNSQQLALTPDGNWLFSMQGTMGKPKTQKITKINTASEKIESSISYEEMISGLPKEEDYEYVSPYTSIGPKGNYIALIFKVYGFSSDHILVVVDLNDKKTIYSSLLGGPSNFETGSIRPSFHFSGNLLAFSRGNKVEVIDLKTGKTAREYNIISDNSRFITPSKFMTVTSQWFIPGTDYLLLPSQKGLFIADVSSDEKPIFLPVTPFGIVLSENQKYFALLHGTTAEIRRIPKGELVASLKHAKDVVTAVFIENGNKIITGGQSLDLITWDIKTGKIEKKWKVNP